MPRDIAVAFEGGGAKLIGLLAAAHALYDLEREGRIRVTSTSGTSAGSIPAFLLAAQADFNKVAIAIRDSDKYIQRHFPPLTGSSLYWRLLRFMTRGDTLYPKHKFEILIDKILSEIGIDANGTIEKYTGVRNAYLIYSDVYNAKSIASEPSENVRAAIHRSCSIPFIFSSHKDKDSGKSADGGILNNLPTDILQENVKEAPIFAISFKPEQKELAVTPLQYIYALVTSSIRHRVAQSKDAIGDKKVLELESKLQTLDFDKLVSVGLLQEYDAIKQNTRLFFDAFLTGKGNDEDSLSETKGRRPLNKLIRTEKSILAYVEDSMRKAACENTLLKMRVNAFSLEGSNRPDEIIVEQIIKFPDKDYIKGIILPLSSGDGYWATVECNVAIDDENGEPMQFEEFLIGKQLEGVPRTSPPTNGSVVLLFKGDLKKHMGGSIYIIKKEIRYGFMLPLKDEKSDLLSVRSHFWPAKRVSIELNVPKSFAHLKCLCSVEGDSMDPGVRPGDGNLTLAAIPPQYRSYVHSISELPLLSRLTIQYSC